MGLGLILAARGGDVGFVCVDAGGAVRGLLTARAPRDLCGFGTLRGDGWRGFARCVVEQLFQAANARRAVLQRLTVRLCDRAGDVSRSFAGGCPKLVPFVHAAVSFRSGGLCA